VRGRPRDSGTYFIAIPLLLFLLWVVVFPGNHVVKTVIGQDADARAAHLADQAEAAGLVQPEAQHGFQGTRHVASSGTMGLRAATRYWHPVQASGGNPESGSSAA
jgi:hypothetical protein